MGSGLEEEGAGTKSISVPGMVRAIDIGLDPKVPFMAAEPGVGAGSPRVLADTAPIPVLRVGIPSSEDTICMVSAVTTDVAIGLVNPRLINVFDIAGT